MRKKLIIDGSNLLHRSYWVAKNKYDKADSIMTVVVFMNMMKRYVSLFEPSEIIVCWDNRKDGRINERKSLFEEYKCNRKSSAGVYDHIDFLCSILSSLGVRHLHPKNREADDIMWYLCAKKYPNKCVLITNDTDMYQLIVPELDENIIYNPSMKKQVNSIVLKMKYDLSDGFDYIIRKALKGDASDNIKGVYGIRMKRIMPIINILREKYDLQLVKDSGILTEEEFEIFERNLKLMKLDYLEEHQDEMDFYEEQLKEKIVPNKEEFRNLLIKQNLKGILQKINSWYITFTKNLSHE